MSQQKLKLKELSVNILYLVEQDPASGYRSLEHDNDEPDQSDPPEELPSLSNNEDVHKPQRANPQTRPGLLKENSYYELFDSDGLKDEEGKLIIIISDSFVSAK